MPTFPTANPEDSYVRRPNNHPTSSRAAYVPRCVRVLLHGFPDELISFSAFNLIIWLRLGTSPPMHAHAVSCCSVHIWSELFGDPETVAILASHYRYVCICLRPVPCASRHLAISSPNFVGKGSHTVAPSIHTHTYTLASGSAVDTSEYSTWAELHTRSSTSPPPAQDGKW